MGGESVTTLPPWPLTGFKSLALKWFHDWKKFKKIQLGKTYAQALLLGKETNPLHVNSWPKQHKLVTQQVSRTAILNKNTKETQNNGRVKRQGNKIQATAHGGSVAGVFKASDTRMQVELKNRFQVLQDTLDHESLQDQGCQNFRVTMENKHAKVNKKHKVAPRPPDSEHVGWNGEITKQFDLNSPQKVVCTDLYSQDVNRQHQKGNVRDLDIHVTDFQPVINGNYEPDNRNHKMLKTLLGDATT